MHACGCCGDFQMSLSLPGRNPLAASHAFLGSITVHCRHWTIVIWSASQFALPQSGEQLSSSWIPFVGSSQEFIIGVLLLWGCCTGQPVYPGKALGTVKLPAHAECPADLGCQEELRVTSQPLLLCDLSLGACASTTLGLPTIVTPDPCATAPPSPRTYLFWLDPVFDLQSVERAINCDFKNHNKRWEFKWATR